MVTTSMAVRRRQALLGVVVCLGVAASSVATAVAQVPTPAVVVSNVSRIAYAEWVEHGKDYVSHWKVDARQSIVTRSWALSQPADAYTQLIISELRCDVIRGKKKNCNSGISRSWEVQPTDFNFDPLMEQAEIVYGPKRKRLVWTATSSAQIEPGLQRRHKKKIDSRNFWLEAESTGFVDVERRARVRGEIAGRNLARVKKVDAGLKLLVGNWGYVTLCLVDEGSICD